VTDERDQPEPEPGAETRIPEPRIPELLRQALEELEPWLEREPDERLAGHALVPATRWVLAEVPGLDLERYTEEAMTFVVATPIWDRALLRYRKDVAYWMAQRLLVDEHEREDPERAARLLAGARAAIAAKAELLDEEGFPRTAQSFRALLDETAGGEPPADFVWNALALRIAEPFLDDAANPVPTPSASPPPSEPPEPASE
jgi:hypothetical protein